MSTRKELVLSVLNGYKAALEEDNRFFLENIDYDLLRNNQHYMYTEVKIEQYIKEDKSSKRLVNLNNLFYIAENGIDSQFINVIFNDINDDTDAISNPLSACQYIALNRAICEWLDSEPVLYLKV